MLRVSVLRVSVLRVTEFRAFAYSMNMHICIRTLTKCVRTFGEIRTGCGPWATSANVP